MSALLRIMVIALAILACSQGHALPGKPGETGVGLGSHGKHNHGNHGNHKHGNHGNHNHGNQANHGRSLPGMPGETGVRNGGNHKHGNKHGNHTHTHGNQGTKLQPGKVSNEQGSPGAASPIN